MDAVTVEQLVPEAMAIIVRAAMVIISATP